MLVGVEESFTLRLNSRVSFVQLMKNMFHNVFNRRRMGSYVFAAIGAVSCSSTVRLSPRGSPRTRFRYLEMAAGFLNKAWTNL